jgi:hypothetical protein
MKRVGILMLLVAGLCWGQGSGDYKPASTNVLDAKYPRVGSFGTAEFRVKAPDAAKVRLNF